MLNHSTTEYVSRKRHFDYYLRSATTAVLALAIVGATLYSIVWLGKEDAVLTGWAGIVLGTYFTYHVSRDGRDAPPTDEQAELMQLRAAKDRRQG